MKTKTILLGILLSGLCGNSSLLAQQRVLLHINRDGEQEAIPIHNGERTEAVLSRLKFRTTAIGSNPSSVRDSLINFGKNGTSNFIQAHADVLFQWFDPVADGFVLEFGWRNGIEPGSSTAKSNIRAWNADKRLVNLPATALSMTPADSSGNMGYYKNSNDGDGLKTPFKDEATDTNFVGGKGDASIRFDPLGKEAKWLKGGHMFNLAVNAWQSFRLSDLGDTMTFRAHEPFGFTKENNLRIIDDDINMLVLANSADEWPYHSLKFYEGTATSNYGWQIRNYEWNFYAIVEYTTDRPPKIKKWDRIITTLKTTPLTIAANITDDNPAGGAAGVKSVDLFAKVNGGSYAKSTMTGAGPVYTGTLPAANPGDTIFYYIAAADVNNLTTTSPVTTCRIFKISKRFLYLWNGRALPTGITSAAAMAQYGMMKDSVKEAVWYDVWDVKTYGTGDIPALLPSYDGVVEATGDGGEADLTGFAGNWLSTGTPQNPKVYFLSDQDHGFISGFSDTAFAETDPHNKYFGLLNIPNQDYAYTLNGNSNVTTPWQIALDSSAPSNPIFSSINKYQKDNGVTLWYHPNYEWPPFLNWMDELRPKAEAKVVFRDVKINKPIGVRKSAPDNSWHTTFLAFDYLGCNFRSDTSRIVYTAPDKDPKYKKLTSVGNLAVNFIKGLTDVPTTGDPIPFNFSLSQNYPNPFNPVTNFQFSIADLRFVELKVFDLLGREVATLVDDVKPAGSYTVQWDATHFASGVYFYRLQSGAFADTKKLLLLK